MELLPLTVKVTVPVAASVNLALVIAVALTLVSPDSKLTALAVSRAFACDRESFFQSGTVSKGNHIGDGSMSVKILHAS